MEIQAQMTINSASTTSAGTAAGNGGAGTANSASGQGAGGFSATLVGILGAVPANEAAAQQAAVLPALGALIQLLGNSEQQQVPTTDEEVFKQLDALIDLLNANTEDAAALLANPELQALLAELQTLLVVQPAVQADTESSNSEHKEDIAVIATSVPSAPIQSVSEGEPVALNPALFVPMETEAALEKTAAATTFMPVSKQEAQSILQQLQQLLQKDGGQAPVLKDGKQLSVQSVVNEIKTLLAQQLTVRHSSETTIANQPTAPASIVNANLEYLAAKSIPFRFEAQSDSTESPLFEPLADMAGTAADSPAIPMSEYLKQVSNGTNTTKTPIVMHAPTFVEDMTQLVMKSFTVNSIAEGITEAKLSLYPQHLGHVEIKLTMHNGQLIAQFMADSMSGKEMLESQLSQLRTTLQNQGIQVDKLEVTQNQAFQSGLFQEQRQQQFQQSGKQSKGNNGDNQLSIEGELLVETKASKVPSGLGQSSIDVTA